MSAGVGGSTYASCLMAALAVGAGQLGGAHEVALAMDNWQTCGHNLATWRERLEQPPQEQRADIWAPIEHPPGFDPHGASCPTPVKKTLAYLAGCYPKKALGWLQQHRSELESAANCPLAMTGVAAATMIDLGFDARSCTCSFVCRVLRCTRWSRRGTDGIAIHFSRMAWNLRPTRHQVT